MPTLPIPIYPSSNLAPLKPLLDLREGTKQPKHYLCDAVKERFQDYLKREEASRREMLLNAQELALFVQGNHFLTFNKYAGQWRALQPKTLDYTTRRGLNILQYFVTNWVSKWEMSNPKVLPKASPERDEAYATSQVSRSLVEKYEKQFYTAWETQMQALLCLVFGTYLNRIRFDNDAKGATYLREVFEDRTIQLDQGYGACGECGHEGTAAEFPSESEFGLDQTCPKCASPFVNVTPPTSDTVSVHTGQEEIELGNLKYERLPFPSCHWNFDVRPEESEWFIYRTNLPLRQLRALIPNVNLPGNAASDDLGLQVVDALARTGMTMSGHSQFGRQRNEAKWKEAVTIEELSLTYHEYADIQIKGDEQTLAGVNLPRGAYLGDVFKENVTFVGVNGMALLIGVYEESHQDMVSSGVCHMKPLSGAGRNFGDAVEPQKRINTFDNQFIQQQNAFGSPGGVYAKDAIDPDDAANLGKPDAWVPIDLSRFPNTTSLNAIAQPMQPALSSPQMLDYTRTHMINVMQYATNIMDFSNGIPNVDITTKGGAEIAQANSDSIVIPALRIKAEARLNTARKIPRLVQKHYPPEYVAQMLGKNAEEKVRCFYASKLEIDLEWEIERDSEVPRNSYTKRSEYDQFFARVGGARGFLQLQESAPDFAQEMASAWNIKLNSVDYADIEMYCQRRLRSMKEAMMQGILNPLAIVAAVLPPVSIAEPNHQQKMKWWSDLLDTDDLWRPESLPLRLAAEIMAQTHFQMIGQLTAAAAVQQGQAVAEASNAANEKPKDKPKEKQYA